MRRAIKSWGPAGSAGLEGYHRMRVSNLVFQGLTPFSGPAFASPAVSR
jgi:hypothetical protein